MKYNVQCATNDALPRQATCTVTYFYMDILFSILLFQVLQLSSDSFISYFQLFCLPMENFPKTPASLSGSNCTILGKASAALHFCFRF